MRSSLFLVSVFSAVLLRGSQCTAILSSGNISESTPSANEVKDHLRETLEVFREMNLTLRQIQAGTSNTLQANTALEGHIVRMNKNVEDLDALTKERVVVTGSSATASSSEMEVVASNEEDIPSKSGRLIAQKTVADTLNRRTVIRDGSTARNVNPVVVKSSEAVQLSTATDLKPKNAENPSTSPTRKTVRVLCTGMAPREFEVKNQKLFGEIIESRNAALKAQKAMEGEGDEEGDEEGDDDADIGIPQLSSAAPAPVIVVNEKKRSVDEVSTVPPCPATKSIRTENVTSASTTGPGKNLAVPIPVDPSEIRIVDNFIVIPGLTPELILQRLQALKVREQGEKLGASIATEKQQEKVILPAAVPRHADPIINPYATTPFQVAFPFIPMRQTTPAGPILMRFPGPAPDGPIYLREPVRVPNNGYNTCYFPTSAPVITEVVPPHSVVDELAHLIRTHSSTFMTRFFQIYSENKSSLLGLTHSGQSLLEVAILESDTASVSVLIGAKIFIVQNTVGSNGKKLVELAIRSGNYELVKSLLTVEVFRADANTPEIRALVNQYPNILSLFKF